MNTIINKRILVVTQYIYPENFKSNELVFEMAKRGYHVDVLTGIPNYPEGVYFKGYGLFKKTLEGQCSLVSALSPQYTQYILLLRRKTTCGSIKGLPQNLLKLYHLCNLL